MKKGKKEQNIVHLEPVTKSEIDALQLSRVMKRKGAKSKWKRISLIVFAILCATIIGVFVYAQNVTYQKFRITSTSNENVDANSGYYEFASGFLKYGKNGVTHLDYNGDVKWNEGYQIANPTVVATKSSAAIGNIGGNEIMVIDKEGVKGEIETNLPILNMSISEQGIVAALLKSESSAEVVCYDAVGNILLEHQSSLTGNGIPNEVVISKDGTVLLIGYLCIAEGQMVGEYVYYDLTDTSLNADKEILREKMPGDIIVEAQFMGDYSVIASGNALVFNNYKKEYQKVIEIEQGIESIFYNDKYLAIIIEGENGIDNELRVYNNTGTLASAVKITGKFSQGKIDGENVILHDGSRCVVSRVNGKILFEGDLKEDILAIASEWGIGRYTIINQKGMQKIQLRR